MPVLEIDSVVKKFKNNTVLNEISFDIGRNEIFGLLGPNGAGKSTMIKIILNLEKADSGSVKIDSLRHDKPELKNILGVQLHHKALFDNLKVFECIDYFASLYKERSPYLDLYLEKLSLTEKLNEFTKNLSEGQKQKLAFILCLINHPQVIILDEPTSNLDIYSRRYFWEILKEEKEKGAAILLTTHNIDEAELICDRIGLLYQGKILEIISVQEFKNKHRNTKIMEIMVDNSHELGSQEEYQGVLSITKMGKSYFFHVHDDKDRIENILSRLIRERGIYPADIRIRDYSVFDIYLAYTGEKLVENF